MKYSKSGLQIHQKCIQAVTLIILSTFFALSGGDSSRVLDLLKALNLDLNSSLFGGVSVAQGAQQRTTYKLSGSGRKLVLPHEIYQQASNLIKRDSDFTFSAILRQEEANSGSIISFSYGYDRYLELQSSGRRNEIRFHYAYKSITNDLMVHVESFPYHLADNSWHKIALSVSGTELQLIVDCNVVYTRVANFVPDRNFSATNMQLFIGQRNIDGHSLFKGEFQEVQLVSGAYGYLTLCEHMSSQCPTCGQFLKMHNTIDILQQKIATMTQKLEETMQRIESLEKCDCTKSCYQKNYKKSDGEKWMVGCDECRCIKGEIKCKRVECEPLKCKHPIQEKGICCPKCLRNCYINKKDYEHGEKVVIGCKNCSCTDGIMNCDKLICPKLDCPPHEWITDPDECCKFCSGVDYCSKGHACHENATCMNLRTKSMCICNAGFTGDGFHCEDINECNEKGGVNGNHCQLNTVCENKFGNYECKCLEGYSRSDKYNCVEKNECKTTEHNCHKDADCINTVGSYICRCKHGYTGNGTYCAPLCSQSCLNGGKCISPGKCLCRKGYIGNSCEKDLNECQTNYHRCKDTSLCVNMPGWYYCKCKEGYEMRNNDCIDIDECAMKIHTCHPSAKCVNTIGSFECSCDNFTTNIDFNKVDTLSKNLIECKDSCLFENNEIAHLTEVSPRNQPCILCTCFKGVITCKERTCDCSEYKKDKRRDLCCPQCDPNESCQHQELKHIKYRSGERWIYQCQICECLYGEFDCWKLECPPITCSNPLPLLPGDCCRYCPEDIDLCGLNNFTNLVGRPCFYDRDTYASEKRNELPSKSCSSCCKDSDVYGL